MKIIYDDSETELVYKALIAIGKPVNKVKEKADKKKIVLPTVTKIKDDLKKGK